MKKINNIDMLLRHFKKETIQFEELVGNPPRFIVVPTGKYERCVSLYECMSPHPSNSPLVSISFRSIDIVPLRDIYFDVMKGLK